MHRLLIVVISVLLSSCYSGPEAPWGFSLPKGDSTQGEQVFLMYQCLSCHTLEGYESETINPEIEPRVHLGGEVATVKTYADLVTSIINPSHKISKKSDKAPGDVGYKQMPNFNEIMTVQELVDLVTFLQPNFKIQEYKHQPYANYYYPE